MRKVTTERIYGEIPAEIHVVFERTLARREAGGRPKRAAFIVVLAVLILALAAVAIAVSYRRSAEFEAVTRAKEAIRVAYGLEPEWLRVFTQEVEPEDGGWWVCFIPQKEFERMGVYSVTVPDDGEATAIWSHDAQDLTAIQAAGFASEFWGAAQIEELLGVWETYQIRYEEMLKARGPEGLWTQEDWVQLDSLLLETGVSQPRTLHVAAGEDDLTEEQAIRLSRMAVKRKYGVDDAKLDAYEVRTRLLLFPEEQRPMYLVEFTFGDDERNWAEGTYVVNLYTPTGNVYSCMWYGDPAAATLPEGSLARHEQVVREYMQLGAFELLGYEAKADVAARLIEAGLGAYIDDVAYSVPKDAKAQEAAVLKAADEALGKQYGLAAETLSYFTPRLSFAQVAGEGTWLVDYEPIRTESLYWIEEFRQKLGSYRVSLSEETGEVLSATWTNDGLLADGTDYTEQNFGAAPAWDARMIPWFAAFVQRVSELEALGMEQAGAEVMEPTVWQAEISALHRAAGFEDYSDVGVPGEGELSWEEAKAVAEEALMAELSLTQAEVDEMGWYGLYRVGDGDRPVWVFSISERAYVRGQFYQVEIDGRTGEVVSLIAYEDWRNG